MAAPLSVRILLPTDAADGLRRPVRGEGGFQNLLRSIQASLSRTNELTLTVPQMRRIARYVERYGQGGFQTRLGGVLAELESLAKALRPMAA